MVTVIHFFSNGKLEIDGIARVVVMFKKRVSFSGALKMPTGSKCNGRPAPENPSWDFHALNSAIKGCEEVFQSGWLVSSHFHSRCRNVFLYPIFRDISFAPGLIGVQLFNPAGTCLPKPLKVNG